MRDDPTPPPRPVVTLDPGVNFGAPTIRGVSVAAMVGMLVAGDAGDVVCEAHGVSRGDLAVACWFEARYGANRRRLEWAAWLGRWEETLWLGKYNPDKVPLPTEETT